MKHLPPAPVPPATVPRGASAAAPGQARLIVDVVDGPTLVQRVEMQSRPFTKANGRPAYEFVEAPRPLCPASPCVVDLTPGNVLLGFPVIGNDSALEMELLHVGAESSVYRRSLSVYNDDTGALRVIGIIATSLGGAAAITGTTLLPIGLSKENDGLTYAGGISLAGGAALLVLGIWAIRTDSPTYRPGSSNHFPMP